MQYKVSFPPHKRYNDSKTQRDDYRHVFSTETGERVLEDIITNLCALGQDVNAFDEAHIRTSIGRQGVGHAILNILNRDINND